MNEKCGRLFAFAFACFFGMWSLFLLLQLANPIVDEHSFSFRTKTGTSVADFVTFYQAGFMCNSGQRTKVYEPKAQLECTNRLIKPDHIDNVFYFQNVPFIFPLLTPLAMLPLTAAYFFWYVLSLAAGLAAITLTINGTHRFSTLERLIILFAILSSAPSIITLKIGQTSWFLLCFLALTYFAIKQRKDLLGGISLALLTIKPQYVPLFFVSLLSLKRWKLLIACFITEALLLLAAGCTIGWENIYHYPAVLLQAEITSNFSGVNPAGMVSIRGVLSQFLSQSAVFAISLPILVLAALLTYKLWQQVGKKNLSSEWAMALTTILCLVVSPHSHVYDLLLLSLPAILTLPNLNLKKIAALPSICLRVWSFILLSYPITSWIAYCFGLSWVFLLLNLILLISGLLHIYTDRSSTDDLAMTPS